ncbi:YeeE/YedE family protein [Geobacter grbiciae]|uniref:YeeE/YedE family protein n=1 Tax=Geobacter grbiciae TaxID=155042 RepID=UPI001C0301C6|nr:YeeE/YedE family protein [Geobacter grbiciae]MBT1074028.1 YeeE/YedE family protein [Geobacter grbiciae]
MFVSPTVIVTAIGLMLGLIAGFVMHRADFCIAGMFRDLFLFRSTARLRALVLYLAVAMVLFEGARLLGLLPLYPFPLLGPASLAGTLGGVLFGIGMVLAGGCVVGTLYRLGAGNRPSLVAFIGLIIGSALYAEFHPFWKSLLTATTLFSGSITIPQYFSLSPTPLIAVAIAILGGLVTFWCRHGQLSRRLYAKGALQLWQAALVLAGVSLASYLLIGMPLGITNAYAKIGAMGEQLVFPDHVAGLGFFASQPLSCRNPLTGMMLTGGPGPALDGIALIQFPLIAGIILGSTVSALSLGEFTLGHPAPWRQYLSAAVGGILMGLASRMAPACNVWHFLGGLPILAFSSIFFLAGILPGAWLGACILTRWVVR